MLLALYRLYVSASDEVLAPLHLDLTCLFLIIRNNSMRLVVPDIGRLESQRRPNSRPRQPSLICDPVVTVTRVVHQPPDSIHSLPVSL